MAETDSNQGWTTEIKPASGWFNLNLKEIWQYRDLLFLFVRRDFVAVYKQTILGPTWFFVQPILTTLTFTVIFGNVAQVSTDGLPKILFYLAGVTSWNYFADCINQTSNTFTKNAAVFGKVYFPRLIVPISVVMSNLIKFGIQFILFVGFLIYFLINGADVHIQKAVILLPWLIILMAGLGLGFGVIISSLTTKYRDLQFLVSFGVQLLMYASPVVYPLSLIMDSPYRILIMLNPMTSVIETFRYAFLGKGVFDLNLLLYSSVFMVCLLFLSFVIFRKTEKNFMDTV